MSIIKTDGVIIRSQDYLESSKIVTCYTKDYGKVALIAKGAFMTITELIQSVHDRLPGASVSFFLIDDAVHVSIRYGRAHVSKIADIKYDKNPSRYVAKIVSEAVGELEAMK